MSHLKKLLFIALATLAAQIGAEESGVSFYHKRWAAICDNTLTCRIASYAKDDYTGGSVLITRMAGANTAAMGEITLSDGNTDELKPVSTLTLWINGRPAGALTATDNGWRLSQTQTQALIDAVKDSGRVEVKGAPQPFQLPDDGAYAVMLKVDDVQGRIGTPGAWIKKGNKPEESVPAAVPAPVIRAAKVSQASPRILSQSVSAALRPRLLSVLKDETDCDYLTNVGEEDVNGHIISGEITATPLDDKHTLLSAQCWGAAYNQGYGYWVTDSTLKAPPVAVTQMAQRYQQGVISSVVLGSSVGACFNQDEWTWDGERFQQSLAMSSNSCWSHHAEDSRSLPTLVTKTTDED